MSTLPTLTKPQRETLQDLVDHHEILRFDACEGWAYSARVYDASPNGNPWEFVHRRTCACHPRVLRSLIEKGLVEDLSTYAAAPMGTAYRGRYRLSGLALAHVKPAEDSPAKRAHLNAFKSAREACERARQNNWRAGNTVSRDQFYGY